MDQIFAISIFRIISTSLPQSRIHIKSNTQANTDSWRFCVSERFEGSNYGGYGIRRDKLLDYSSNRIFTLIISLLIGGKKDILMGSSKPLRYPHVICSKPKMHKSELIPIIQKILLKINEELNEDCAYIKLFIADAQENKNGEEYFFSEVEDPLQAYCNFLLGDRSMKLKADIFLHSIGFMGFTQQIYSNLLPSKNSLATDSFKLIAEALRE